MSDSEALEVPPGMLQGTDGISNYTSGDCSVKPQRLTLVPIETWARPPTARERLDLAST